MEKSDEVFKIRVKEASDKYLLIRPEETTDGVPVYHCYSEGISICQLRREPSGEWTQLWGGLSADSVGRIGGAIVDHML